jgi:DNA-binding NtrC family response regulator
MPDGLIGEVLMESAARVLFVCPPGPSREELVKVVDRTGASHVITSTATEAEKALADAKFDLIITGRTLSDGDFGTVVRAAESYRSYTPVVVVSRSADWNEFVEAIDRGAFDLLSPSDMRIEAVRRVLKNALLASAAQRGARHKRRY